MHNRKIQLIAISFPIAFVYLITVLSMSFIAVSNSLIDPIIAPIVFIPHLVLSGGILWLLTILLIYFHASQEKLVRKEIRARDCVRRHLGEGEEVIWVFPGVLVLDEAKSKYQILKGGKYCLTNKNLFFIGLKSIYEIKYSVDSDNPYRLWEIPISKITDVNKVGKRVLITFRSETGQLNKLKIKIAVEKRESRREFYGRVTQIYDSILKSWNPNL